MKVTRFLFLFLIASIVVSLMIYAWRNPYSRAYIDYFRTSKAIQIDFENIKPITQAEWLSAYPLNWWCESIPLVKDPLGDSACQAEIKKWNQQSAMGITVWFMKDHASLVKIDVPNWYFASLQNSLLSQYGAPTQQSKQLDYTALIEKLGFIVLTKGHYSGSNKVLKPKLNQRELKSGALLVSNAIPSKNPFQWNSVLWFSPDRVKSQSVSY